MLKYANTNTVLKLTSGKQILPLLHIEDCVSGIISLMNNLDRQKCYKEVYISEQIQLSVKDIVLNVMKFRPLNVEYGAITERKNEFYERIECPMERYKLEQHLDFNEYLKAQLKKEIYG
jgi:nucleoside-diphosphate-sugar epimerase